MGLLDKLGGAMGGGWEPRADVTTPPVNKGVSPQVGMPGGTPGPTPPAQEGGLGLGAGGAPGGQGPAAGGWGSNAGGKFSADGFGGNFGGAKTNNMANGGSWTNENNPLSGGLLGKLPGFNKPTGWAMGVDPKYMGPVSQGGTGGSLPGAMNQWMNNPALKAAQQEFQAKMKGQIQNTLQGQIDKGMDKLGGGKFGMPGQPPEWMTNNNNALASYKVGLNGKTADQLQAMFDELQAQAELNPGWKDPNSPEYSLYNQKLQAMRDYGMAQGFDNWLSPEQKIAKLQKQYFIDNPNQ